MDVIKVHSIAKRFLKEKRAGEQKTTYVRTYGSTSASLFNFENGMRRFLEFA